MTYQNAIINLLMSYEQLYDQLTTQMESKYYHKNIIKIKRNMLKAVIDDLKGILTNEGTK